MPPFALLALAPCVLTSAPVEVRLAATPVSCTLYLTPGAAAEVTIEQGDRDLETRIHRPGQKPAAINLSECGPERILIAAGPAPETIRLEISSPQKRIRPTTHRLATRIRPAEPQDQARHDAQRLLSEAHFAEPAAARSLVLQSLELSRGLADPEATATALTALASLDYIRAGFPAVLAGSAEALAIARQRGLPWIEATSLNNIGVAHWQLGDLRQFREVCEQALTIARAIGYKRGEIAIRNNLGISYRETGDNQKSRDQYNLALPIARALGEPDTEGYIWSSLASAYQALAETGLAITAATRAGALFRQANAPRPEARTWLRLAELHLQSNALAPAAKAAAEATRLTKLTADARAEADAETLSGKIAAAKKDYTAAAQYASQALALYRERGSLSGEAAALHLTGEILERTATLDAAADSFHQALRIRRDLGARNEEAETLYRLAVIEKRRGNLDAARVHIDAAIARIEELRALVAGPKYRMSYLASKAGYFAFSTELLLDLHLQRPAEGFDVLAFDTVERSRARGLLDQIAESPAVRRDPAVQPRVQALLESLNTWSARAAALAATPGKTAEAAAARQKAAALLDEYYALESEIRARRPDAGAKALTAAEIRARVLDSRTVLFEYFLGPTKSALWTLTPGSIRTHILPGRAAIDDAARAYLAELKSAPHKSGKSEAAARLSALLLKPGWAAVRENRLLISATGSLQLLPFAALPEPGSSAPLLAAREVVMTPSASALDAARRRPRPTPSRSIAIVADPVFDSADARIPGSRASGRAPAFPRLVFSRQEANEIAKLFPLAAKPFTALDFLAARALFQHPSPVGAYSYLHIATHSAYQPDDPDTPALVLSQVDNRGAPLDGFVRARDIAQLDLRASVVTLSACASANARDLRGEGLAGLAHGFLEAGARAVVVSLWQVGDEPAAELMVRFYRGMQSASQSGPAAALRAAQDSMRLDARWAAPRDWAAWQIVGDWRQ